MNRMLNITVSILCGLALICLAGSAWAQAGGECSGGACGTPMTSGGSQPCYCTDGSICDCDGAVGSILIANTDTGETYQYSDDYDEDFWEDDFDNCPYIFNQDQLDTDGDGFGDLCDNCPRVADRFFLDSDGDGEGDVCDVDADNDGVPNLEDTCPLIANPKMMLDNVLAQKDTDGDGMGDACDTDDDGDDKLDFDDNCPLVFNPLQKNTDPNAFGDACDEDADKDNIKDSKDNCRTVANPDQLDSDDDTIGDACDADLDNDQINNLLDNCPNKPNADQMDADRDGKGDACDSRFCWVINNDEHNCLDPKDLFRVFSTNTLVNTGESVRLRLFANRIAASINYKWIVEQAPAGSNAAVTNPAGSVSVSTPYEYHYNKGQVATFTADEPGEYKIKLVGKLAFPDTNNSNWAREHSYVMSITAEGESMGGCSVAGATSQASLGFILAGLMLLGFRRRRN